MPPLLALCLLAPPAPADDATFPRDPSVLDVRRDFGAKGDGVADDTDALQKGFDASTGRPGPPSRVLFIPNGTYRVTKTIIVHSAVGPWVYGQSRDGVRIKLDDGAKDVTAVIRCHPREKGDTSADWFMRNLYNLTVDVGNNPETDGVRWHSTNTGALKNVRVVGKGKIGVNSSFMGQNGPNLVQDVTVEGFDTGLLSQWFWGQTLSRVTVKNCRRGLVVSANAVGAEDLVFENCAEPILVDIPNDWYWWSGVLALRGATITGNNPGRPAIVNKGVLWASDVRTTGYAKAIGSTSPVGDAAGNDVAEYTSLTTRKAFDASAGAALKLPAEREPAVGWEPDLAKWVCVDDFGAKSGDNQDDTAAFQAAVDAAAKAGKTTVYLRGIGGGDPNWYTLDGAVRVHGSVRHVVGLGFGRILAKRDVGKFVVGDGAGPLVKFQNLDSFGGTPPTLELTNPASTLLAEGCGVHVRATAGKVFLTNCPAGLDIGAGVKAWCRHLNPEGESDDGLVKNAGGDLWVLGMKHEGRGVRVRTSAGGRTELMGVFNYGSGTKRDDPRPLFDVDESSLSLMGFRDIAFGGDTPVVKVRERRGGEVRTHGQVSGEHGWVGWAFYSGRK